MANGPPEPAAGGRRQHGPSDRAFALVPAAHYFRREAVTPVSRFPTATTVELLGGPGGDGVAVLPRPDEYYGYVAAYRRFAEPAYAVLFSRSLLAVDRPYRVVGEPTYFDATLNLIATPVRPIGRFEATL